MSVVVPSYAYTFIRIEFLKKIIMDEDSLKEVKEIGNIQEFIEYIMPYYPELNIEEYTISEIEKELNRVFVMIVGKIMSFAPDNMRAFLKDYLLRFEIMNIKNLILGAIIGMSREEKSRNINFLVEKYLGKEDLIRGLLEIPSLDEIRLYMRGTIYNKAIREGILYFKNNNEIFVLEGFLDQLYYHNLKLRKQYFNKKEKEVIALFIDILIEIFNLNMIYRGILNNIDRNLLNQFLVENTFFLEKDNLQILLKQENVNNFFSKIEQIFNKTEDIKKIYQKMGIKREHFHWAIEGLYINYFFSKFKTKIDDIDYTTILRIIEVLIKKQKEIQFDILPSIVKIVHDKYNRLESYGI